MSLDEEKEKLRIAFMKIMNCKQIKLFGALLYKFETAIIDDPNMSAVVFFNPKTKKPNIVFGRELVKKQRTHQLVFIMLHEMLHFINNHHRRGTMYDRVISNLAADHVVNEVLLKDLGGIEIELDNGSKTTTSNSIGEVCEVITDPKPFIIEELMGKRGVTFESAYEWLMKNKVQYIAISPSPCGNCGDSGKDSKEGDGKCKQCPGKGGQGGKTKYKVKVPGQAEQEFTPDIDDGDGSGDDDQTGEEEKQQQQAAQKTSDELKNDLRSIINGIKDSTLTRGMEGSRLLEYFKELTKVKIPWDELVEIAIKNNVIPSMENRSWKNPQKRLRTYNIVLPGQGVETKASTMVVVIDTSGSVGSDDLKKFISICNDSLMHFDRLIGIQHDHDIKKVTIVEKDDTERGLDDLAHIVGRGGTSHDEVFEYIEKELWHEDEEVGLVIMLTDYCSDVEENWVSGKYNWINEYPVKIVLNHDNSSMVSSIVDATPIVIEDA